MFKTTEWGSDVPKVGLKFGKKAVKIKKSLQKSIENNYEVMNNTRSGHTKVSLTKSKKKKVKTTTTGFSLLKKSPQSTFGNNKNKEENAKNIKPYLKRQPGQFVTNPCFISKKEEASQYTVKNSIVSSPKNKEAQPKKVIKTNSTFADSKISKRKIKQVKAPVISNNKTKFKSSQESEKATYNAKPKKETKSNNICPNVSNKNKRKRKLDSETVTSNKNIKKSLNEFEESNYNTDKPTTQLNIKKKKFNDALKKDDCIDILFRENSSSKENEGLKKNGQNKKKEKIKKVLDLGRNSIRLNGNNLRDRMLEKLKAAQFRYLNEKLYTTSGSEAQQLFQSDPTAFHTYHEGYQQQLKKWPINPLDIIVKNVLKMPKSAIIADMGCGEAMLSKRVPHSVRSFDLVASNPSVEVCDMAHTPLLTSSVDVVVYCLALMGTCLTQFLVEANRVLKLGGTLLIAEVESRFEDVDSFTHDVARLGFKLHKLDKSTEVFYFFEFKKVQDPPVKKAKLPVLSLKPCLYKRR